MAFARRPVYSLVILISVVIFPATRGLAAKQTDETAGDAAVTIGGEITSASGSVSGAMVYVFGEDGSQSKTLSDDVGRFQVDLSKNGPSKILVLAKDKISQIRSLNPNSDSQLRVEMKDQIRPLSGRIIDLQGMGVADAKLRVLSLQQKNQTLAIPGDLQNEYFDSVTNARGEFSFDGIEPALVGQIRVTGNGIVDSNISAAHFEDEIVLVVQPGRVVEGRVVDRISKQPVSEATISSLAGGQYAEVNQNGEFSIRGIPAFQPVQLTARATGSDPYLVKFQRLAAEQGFGPTDVEIELEPGVWVNCQVKDFGSDGPANAEVYYFPTPENKNFQSFVDSFIAQGMVEPSSTNSSGEAATVAIPGPGVIAIVAPGFPPNESVNQLTDEQRAMLQGITRRNDLTAVAWIDPANLKDAVELKFVVSKGRSIDVEVTDERLDTTDQLVIHRAASKTSYSQRVIGKKFVAEQFQPGETRQILIHALDKRLGAILNVRAEADSPVQAGLEPTGSVFGRIVDKLGNPESGLLIQFETESGDGYQEIAMPTFTDANGRFDKPSLVASLEYRISAIRNSDSQQMMSGAPMMDSRWFVAEQLKVNSNETVDLGTIVLNAKDQPEPVRRPRKEAVKSNNALPSLISGMVTDHAGEPVADAVVLFNTWPNRVDSIEHNSELKPQILAQARSDSNGNFQITIDTNLENKLIGSNSEEGIQNSAIVVLAEKQGVFQIPLQGISDSQNLEIQLVREMIVRGNVVTSNEGGTVQLMPGPRMDVYDGGTIKQIIAELKSGSSLAEIRKKFQPIATVDPLAAGLPLSWEISSTGAFLVRKIPLNAIFELHAIEDSGHRKTVTVISRPLREFDIKPSDGSVDTRQLFGSRIKLNLVPVDTTKQ